MVDTFVSTIILSLQSEDTESFFAYFSGCEVFGTIGIETERDSFFVSISSARHTLAPTRRQRAVSVDGGEDNNHSNGCERQ